MAAFTPAISWIGIERYYMGDLAPRAGYMDACSQFFVALLLHILRAEPFENFVIHDHIWRHEQLAHPLRIQGLKYIRPVSHTICPEMNLWRVGPVSYSRNKLPI